MNISPITVCYNSAATIAHSLQSVNGQTHTHISQIVIDGGSTDGTADLVRQHGTRVTTLISEPDHGIYDAMNKGLRLLIANPHVDVIGFLNADDSYAHPEVLAHVAQHMERGNLDALFGDVAFFHADAPDKLVRRYSSAHFTPDRIGWGWMPAHPALFVRREVFERAGLFRTDYRIAGDYEWVARAFKGDTLRYHYLPEVLVHMQTGGVSTGGWRNSIVLNQEVLRACRENGIATNWFKLLSKYPLKALEYLHA